MSQELYDTMLKDCADHFMGSNTIENELGMSVCYYFYREKMDHYNRDTLIETLKKMNILEILSLVLNSTSNRFNEEYYNEQKNKLISNINILLLTEKMKEMDQKINDISDRLNIIIDALTLMDQVKSNL